MGAVVIIQGRSACRCVSNRGRWRRRRGPHAVINVASIKDIAIVACCRRDRTIHRDVVRVIKSSPRSLDVKFMVLRIA